MHFNSPICTLVLLCTCLVLLSIQYHKTVTASEDADGQGRAFNEPKTKRSGKVPRMSVDLGFFKLDTFFSEQKLEDRLRLSKSYLKYHMTSPLLPSEDPLITMKHSRVEELINCENLTTLIKEPQVRAPLIDCRPLAGHTEDDSYVSPVSDLSISQYVRRSSYRFKYDSILGGRSSRYDVLIYPMKRSAAQKHIESYVTENKLGDISSIKSNINLGYHVHMDLGSSDSLFPVTCIGDVFLSINNTETGYSRMDNDPYPQFLDDLYFLKDQAQKNGYLLNLHGFECTRANIAIDIHLAIDFTIMQRQEFPYLFVRHNMTTRPFDFLLKYESSVDQVRTNNQQSDSVKHPESYNTTVRINSGSGLFNIMNFALEQSISNEDMKTGMESARLVSENFPMVVSAMWNDTLFFKSFQIMETFKKLDQINLRNLLNITYVDTKNENFSLIMMHIQKNLLPNLFNLDNLLKMLGLEGTMEYDTKPEDEQSLREEL